MQIIRVLYVEDDRADQELTRRHLERHASHIKLKIVETVAQALDELTIVGGMDVVLSDYRLPDGTGLDLLEGIKARDLPVPVILVTRSGDAEAAVRLLKAGAVNYIVKQGNYLVTLPSVIEDAFRWFESTTELRRAVVRVLFVEHDPSDVELTRRAFHEHGRHLQLDVAWAGHEALERLRTNPYDLVLLDHRLPDLSGIEVLKALRDERIRVPVVMVTGEGDEETAIQAFKLGAADYVIKREGYLIKLPSTLEHVLAQRRLADDRDALVVLNELARELAAVHDRRQLVERVTQAAVDLLRTDGSVLWLRDGAALEPAGWVGVEASLVDMLELRVDEETREHTLAERPVRLDLRAGASGLNAPATSGKPPVQTLALPLGSGRLPVGVLAVVNLRPRQFRAAEERLLAALANHAAVAAENVELYHELSQRLEELRRAQGQLLQTEKIAAMGQLLAGVAHELNNPLTIVTGLADILRQALAGSPLAEQAGKIAQAAHRCARIVRNFLALARQHPPERRPVHLNQVIREALELLAYPLRVDNVAVTLSLAEDVPLLWADSHQLHQVVVNLVSNAHQAMRQSPPPRQLTLMTGEDRERGQVILEVADSGPGIPRELLARIFEPFFTTKRVGQGTGLGLSLCQGIIENHGGLIRVESPPGHGAVFRVELPCVTSPEVEVPAPGPVVGHRLHGKAILVVEDEPEIAMLLRDMLLTDGHQVETAANGAMALAKLRERAYDLILSDLRMPDLDGPGLYQAIENEHPRLHQRVVFITGDTLDPEICHFMERTDVPSLSKPFTPADVRLVVERVLVGSAC